MYCFELEALLALKYQPFTKVETFQKDSENLPKRFRTVSEKEEKFKPLTRFLDRLGGYFGC